MSVTVEYYTELFLNLLTMQCTMQCKCEDPPDDLGDRYQQHPHSLTHSLAHSLTHSLTSASASTPRTSVLHQPHVGYLNTRVMVIVTMKITSKIVLGMVVIAVTKLLKEEKWRKNIAKR